MSPWQPVFLLSIQRVGDISLTTDPLFQTGPALLLRHRCWQQSQGLLLFPGAAFCTVPTHARGECSDRRVPFLKDLSTGATTLLSKAEGMRGQRRFRSCGCITPSCGDKLRQAAAASHRPDSDFPKNAVLSQRRCPGKEAFALCGFLPPCCEY